MGGDQTAALESGIHLKRTQEIDQLKQEIAELEETIADPKKMKKIIIAELKETAKKYGQPRKTLFYYASDIEEEPDEEDIPIIRYTCFCRRVVTSKRSHQLLSA